jgi:hypothetical protein
LTDNTTGCCLSAFGASALANNTTADYNTAVGYQAMFTNTTGASNSALGKNALVNATTANHNVALGADAFQSATTGFEGVAIGSNAGGNVTTGGDNVLIGYVAGNHNIGLSTGAGNIIVGAYSDTPATNTNYAMVIGYDVTGVGENNFTFGRGSTDSNIAFGATSITAPSDVRLKEDIVDEKVGLEFINELRPVTFRWKKAKDVSEELTLHKADSEERVMNGKYNHGFIAQEVKETIDKYNLKEGFDMWQEDEVDGRQRIGDASLMPILVKAVQELSAKVDELENKLN